MARRGRAYPQVRFTAIDLVDRGAVATGRGIRVGAALELARNRNAGVVVAGGRPALREDLSRADRLGLGELRATDVARDVPVVNARTEEVAVRRRLRAGAPLVLVCDQGRPVGAVAARGVGLAADGPTPSGLARWVPPGTSAILARIGRLAAAQRARAFLVGGLVRDVCRAMPVERGDLDVVIEGDGLALARELARDLRGSILEHPRFLTASVRAPEAGRIDVATARSERYEARGALPRVLPATLEEDLRRRDFTINAMAIELGSGAFGLLDPVGGRADLAARRLRVLHPLSYVEDPTRIFRGARYVTRLGLSPDRGTVRAQALALRLVPYPALSGERLAAELARVLGEVDPASILVLLGRGGTFRLLDARYRFTATTLRRVHELPAALAWAVALGASPVELTALALVGDQPRPVAVAALARLAFTGERYERLVCALDGAPAARAGLAGAIAPSARAAELRGRSPVELGWLWLTGDGPTRAAVDWFARLGPSPVELTGNDVVALGVAKGPAVARVLAELLDGRLDGRLTSRAMEIEHVRRWTEKGG